MPARKIHFTNIPGQTLSWWLQGFVRPVRALAELLSGGRKDSPPCRKGGEQFLIFPCFPSSDGVRVMAVAHEGFAEKMSLAEGSEVTLRVATEADMDDIKHLYYLVYGGRYTLPEVNDRDKMKWAIHDPNYFWLLCEDLGRLVGSVIFVVDPGHKIGKSLAGVILPDYRGHKLMMRTIKRGLDYLCEERNLCELVYAVVRTFISPGFHRDLESIGFVDTGIFPNVRKIGKYETHGLKVYVRDSALQARRHEPRLSPEANQIYEIVRERMGLEPARVEKMEIERKAEEMNLELLIEKSPEVEWEYYRMRDEGRLRFSFFPFHYPQIRLYTRDWNTVAYIHFQETDGHGGLMGLLTDQNDLVGVLNVVSGYCESMGIRYLELLLEAYDPYLQRIAYEANFLPCAYFPAASRQADGTRLDYIVTSNSFVPPNFKGLRLSESTKPFLETFYKIYTARLWSDIQKDIQNV